MKLTSVIFLLILLQLPVIWNGISFIHYVIEHTHTLCSTTTEHAHPDPENCLSVFQLAESQRSNQFPPATTIEFQELKQYLPLPLYSSSIESQSVQQINFVDIFFLEYLFTRAIFHPPIFVQS